MSWQVLALISVTTVAISNIINKLLMKDDKNDPIGYGILFQYGLFLFSLIATLMLSSLQLPQGNEAILRFLLSAVLWALYTVFTFSALKKLGAGEATILFSAGSLPPIFFGVILFKEVMTLKLAIGVLLILFAIWVVTTEKLTFKSRRGVVFALLAALFSGIAVVNDAIILKSYNAYSYMAIMSLLPGILLSVFFFKRLRTTVSNLKGKSFWNLSVLCFFYTIQGITYYLAFQSGAPISQLSPISRTSVVLTVIFAAVFIGERSNLLRKILAAVIMFAGVMLLG